MASLGLANYHEVRVRNLLHEVCAPLLAHSLVAILAARALVFGFLSLSSLISSSLVDQPFVSAQLSAPEYEVKAAFVYNITKFVEWPKEPTSTETPAPALGPLQVIVVGKNPFGDYLINIFKGRLIEGRGVEVKTVERFDPKLKADILFVAPSALGDFAEIVEKLPKGTLLMADSPGLLEKGAVVNFVMTDNKVRFEINRKAAATAGVQISSKLLALAQRVIE